MFSRIPLAKKYPPKYNSALFIFTATIVSIIFPCKYPKGIDKRELIKIKYLLQDRNETQGTGNRD